MTLKEIGELRRQLKPEKSAITKIYGCYINQMGEPISDFEQSIGLLKEEEKEYYHNLLKKVLSGGQGRNLFDLSFPTQDVAHGAFHKQLMDLVRTKCADEEIRTAFYQQVVSSIKLESNYLILLACNAYDVPRKNANDEADLDASDEVFTHIICAICPVKQPKPGLGYHTEEKVFHTSAGDYLVGVPQLGFLFPAFDNRSANIYNALYYLRKEEEGTQGFVQGVFGLETPPSAEQQRGVFSTMLESLEDQCSMEVVNTLSLRVRELAEEHKTEHRDEDFNISGDELRLILDECGVTEERLDTFSESFEEEFGKGECVNPGVIMNTKACQVKLPEISIKASAEAAERIETRIIDGIKYVMIRTEGDVEVNGINISIKE